MYIRRHNIGSKELIYQAIWADNKDFDEILISPVMIQDHMPERLAFALDRLLVNIGPQKPQRKPPAILQNNNDVLSRPLLQYSPAVTPSSFDRTPSHCVILETSFTDLQPMALDEMDFRDRMKRAKPSLITTLRHHRKLDLLKEDWSRGAPLASPETLSDTSSLTSLGQVAKSISMPAPMETISQSPFSSQKSRRASQSSLIRFSSCGPNLDEESKLSASELPSEASTRKMDEETKSPLSVACARSEVSLQELIDVFSSSERFSPTPANMINSIKQEVVGKAEEAEAEEARAGLANDCPARNPDDISLRPLRRSHEELNLRLLLEQPVSEPTPIPTTSALQTSPIGCMSGGQMSPRKLLLFQKLLTIESPNEETLPEDWKHKRKAL